MTFDEEDEEKSERESVYDILDAAEGMDHESEENEEEEVTEDFREQIDSFNIKEYEDAIIELQDKVNREYEEHDILILYGIYDDGATVAGVRPSRREGKPVNFYVSEDWAMVTSEQSISPTDQFRESIYEEDLVNAIEDMKFGLPEELRNRATHDVEDALEELERNPLTREVHGTYIFPGDRRFDGYDG